MSNKHHELLGVPKHANQHRLSRLTMEVHTDELRIMASAVESYTDELIAALEAAENRITELEARPVAPLNFKENSDADFCREWAWTEIKKDLPTENWSIPDEAAFYAFYLMGWDSRRQFSKQRAAEYTGSACTSKGK